jgi:hypothetical protein
MIFTHAEQRRQQPLRSFYGGNAAVLAAIVLLLSAATTTTTTIRTAEAFSSQSVVSVTNGQIIASSFRLFSASTAAASASLSRELGSQENLMLPRQYGVNQDVTFPSMNHVSCAVLAKGSDIPSEAALLYAITKTMEAHPLLRATIEGDGEPDERIDLFQMVRKGDNSACTFVAGSEATFRAEDVLKIVDVKSDDSSNLEASWRKTFLNDLDDGSTWCDVSSGRTPLWKLELHRSSDAAVLVFSFNHAISDQSSASRLTDQILSLAADFESESSTKTPSKQNIPPSVEESVLGRDQRFKDIETGGFGLGTIKYIGEKALEETMVPVILPDNSSNKSEGGGLAGALATISGNAAGGEDEKSLERKSVIAFRSLSKETTEKLLQSCRAKGVSITNALSAALTLASTNFVSGTDASGKKRNYKILQSLDMRRFGASLDKGESVGCLAGSMDLMHKDLKDGSGTALLEGSEGSLEDFWKLAGEGKAQTANFIDSDGPIHAVRVFDFAMTISDLNNLVHLTAQSKDSQGRAYSAGFANAGVYERFDAFGYEGEDANSREKTSVRV